METQPNNTLLKDLWWLLLLQGISAIVLGILLLTQPASTTDVIVVFIGAYWLVSGVFAIVRIFTASGRAHWGWSLLSGLISIIAGIFVLKHPLISAFILPVTLVVVIAVFGIMAGILDLIRGFKGDGVGAFILGILNILIGILLWLNPFAAAVSLPFVLGFFGVVGGISLVYYAFQVRKEVFSHGS